MDTKPRALPPDGGLKEPVRAFEDTFSAETVAMEHFFPDHPRIPTKSTVFDDSMLDITSHDLANAESRGYNRGYVTGFMTGLGAMAVLLIILMIFFP